MATTKKKDWGVNLYLSRSAKTPADAVSTFLEDTLQVGLANYTYSVKDLETGEIFFVEDGRAYTEGEFNDKLNAEVEADDADTDEDVDDDGVD